MACALSLDLTDLPLPSGSGSAGSCHRSSCSTPCSCAIQSWYGEGWHLNSILQILIDGRRAVIK